MCMQDTCCGGTKEEHDSFSVWQFAAEHLRGTRSQGAGMKLATPCALSVTRGLDIPTQIHVHRQVLCCNAVSCKSQALLHLSNSGMMMRHMAMRCCSIQEFQNLQWHPCATSAMPELFLHQAAAVPHVITGCRVILRIVSALLTPCSRLRRPR